MPTEIALLTGGGDRPYALGLAEALIGQEIRLDFIGSDLLDERWLRENSKVRFLNLRGDQNPDVSVLRKLIRVMAYYGRLIRYAATARPKVFHLLWNNKFEWFDRTLLMLYYRLLGKRVVFTAHNVNAGQRDGNDTWLNRLTLKIQYRLCDCVFVHTRRMADELRVEFGLPEPKISVIPFGINNTLPITNLTRAEARQRLGIGSDDRTLLFFGNIAPYKGLDGLVEALIILAGRGQHIRLIIAGRPKGSETHWTGIRSAIARGGLEDQVIEQAEYIPDDEVEVYFKAADLLVLPYTHIFQSGVLFLGYSFGLPVLATDVGSMKEDIVPDRTGLVCPANDRKALAQGIETYFDSALYRELEQRRPEIKAFANERYSWSRVGEITRSVYERLLGQHAG